MILFLTSINTQVLYPKIIIFKFQDKVSFEFLLTWLFLGIVSFTQEIYNINLKNRNDH